MSWEVGPEQPSGTSVPACALDGFVGFFGDGSGGQFSSDPRRRRVGGGSVVLNKNRDSQFRSQGWPSTLTGRRQTPPRAGLLALELALSHVSGPFEYAAYRKALFTGRRRRRYENCNGPNSGL